MFANSRDAQFHAKQLDFWLDSEWRADRDTGVKYVEITFWLKHPVSYFVGQI